MNILSIQSWVAYGHVGNASAVFPLQRLGADVWSINTEDAYHEEGDVVDEALIVTVGLAESEAWLEKEPVADGDALGLTLTDAETE